MAPSLSPASTIYLIECFKDESCLWDFNNDQYNKKDKRASALKRIVQKMKENGDEISGNFIYN